MVYLYDGQLLGVIAVFVVAIYFSNRIFASMNHPDVTNLLIVAFLLAAFMADFALVLARDLLVGIGILVLLVLIAQSLLRVDTVHSVVLIIFAWLIGTVVLGAIQGSLNFYNFWA